MDYCRQNSDQYFSIKLQTGADLSIFFPVFPEVVNRFGLVCLSSWTNLLQISSEFFSQCAGVRKCPWFCFFLSSHGHGKLARQTIKFRSLCMKRSFISFFIQETHGRCGWEGKKAMKFHFLRVKTAQNTQKHTNIKISYEKVYWRTPRSWWEAFVFIAEGKDASRWTRKINQSSEGV